MIKEWCAECKATGSVYPNSTDELCEINGEDCLNCQGKGWVGLEPSTIGDNNEIEVFAQLDLRSNGQWEVYIKEIKEEKSLR